MCVCEIKLVLLYAIYCGLSSLTNEHSNLELVPQVANIFLLPTFVRCSWPRAEDEAEAESELGRGRQAAGQGMTREGEGAAAVALYTESADSSSSSRARAALAPFSLWQGARTFYRFPFISMHHTHTHTHTGTLQTCVYFSCYVFFFVLFFTLSRANFPFFRCCFLALCVCVCVRLLRLQHVRTCLWRAYPQICNQTIIYLMSFSSNHNSNNSKLTKYQEPWREEATRPAGTPR